MIGEMTVSEVEALRLRLLLDHPFFATCALHLELIPDASIETAQTNGTWMKFNPAYFARLEKWETMFVIAHEAFHCASLHPWRRGARDPKRWNEACDFVANSILLGAGLRAPEKILVDAQYDGMSAEQVYSLRRSQQQPDPQEPEPSDDEDDSDDISDGEPDDSGESEDGDDDGDGDSEGSGEPEAGSDEEGDGDVAEEDAGSSEAGSSGGSMPGSPTGEFVDGATTSEEGELREQDWAIVAGEAALAAERAGQLPGSVGRLLQQSREPKIDWIAETRSFLTDTIESDVCWSRPNRRFIGDGLYLPGPRKENVGALVVGVDVSGSVTQQMLDEFASELVGLLRDVRPEKLTVVYCDTRVCGVEEFEPDSEPKLTLPKESGGGTEFQPVFDYVEREGLDPLATIFLTDLEGPAPSEPSYPVLWITPMYSCYSAPFGTLVRIP